MSTGAALALVTLPLLAALGREAIYVESVSRFDGPSLTGRALARVPGVATFTQHSTWSSRTWPVGPTVLGDFVAEPIRTPKRIVAGEPRVFVTLGTIRPFRFDALIDNVLAILPERAEVVWQTGVTARQDLPGSTVVTVSAEEFDDLVLWSDVVISHAGVGSILRMLELGKRPIVVPRRRSRSEHVDDHQLQVSDVLGQRGLVVALEAGSVTAESLAIAGSARIRDDSTSLQQPA